jgi:Tetratricopeptide repeat/Putative zinc-finger
MNCQELDRDDLAEKYLSGQLDPAVQDEFETHILECPRCLQTLEVLQNVHDDLAARAHEIRAQTGAPYLRLRWQWVAAVPVVLIAGVVGLYRLRHVAPSAPQSQSAMQSPSPAEVRNEATTRSGVEVAQEHNGASLSPTPSPAIVPKKLQPSLPPAPDLADSSASRTKFSSDERPPTTGNGKSTTSAAKQPEPESPEVAKERFRLGIVEPPPYTFSGFASAKPPPSKISKSGMAKTLDAKSAQASQRNFEVARGLFQRGMAAYVEQRYDTAAGFLESAAQAEPDVSDINFFLGICRLMLGRPKDALVPLKNAVAAEKSPLAQSAHFYLAKAYVQTGDLADAEIELKAAAAMPGRLRTEAESTVVRLHALRATEEKQVLPPSPH